MKSFVVALIVAALLTAGTIHSLWNRVVAQAAADTAAQLDVGPRSTAAEPLGPPTGPAVAATPTIHDPVSAPSQAFDELKAARKIGWPAVSIAALAMLLLALGHIGIPWLKDGSRAFALAALTTGASAAALAALDGGAWTAVATAGVAAAYGFWQVNRTHAAAVKAAKAVV